MRRNRGAAGIDRTTIADVEEYGVSRLLDELVSDLRDGTWRRSADAGMRLAVRGCAARRQVVG